MKISGLVITYNEEKYIGQCIDLLYIVCDEIVIVDSLSQDKTSLIAKEKACNVIEQKFLGDGPQRSYGLQFCKHDWILNVDADEYLDLDAISFLKSGVFLKQDYDAYAFRRKNFFKNRLIKSNGWYPDYTIRFFNKKVAHPSTEIVHQNIVAKKVKKENVHLLHYQWNNFKQVIDKKNTYTTWQAEEAVKRNEKVLIFTPFIHSFYSFFQHYFFKKGFTEGLNGFTFSIIQAFFSFMKYVKIRQKQD